MKIKNRQLALSISETQYQLIEKLAKKRSMNISKLLRSLLYKEFEELRLLAEQEAKQKNAEIFGNI